MSIAASSNSRYVSTSTRVPAIGRDIAVRANPSYRLETCESLPKATRAQLSTVVAAKDGVCVLVGTPGSALPAKLVDDSGARLFATLSRPGPVPDEVARDQLMGLVLDAVLEVDWDNAWVSGPLAYEALLGPSDPPEPTDRLSRLSYQAIARAERMPLGHETELCARLYGFGRLPLSRRWIRSYPGPDAVAALFDLDALHRDWVIGGGEGGRVDWLSFSRRGGMAAVRVPDLPYKLYVSPPIDALPAVLPDIAAALAANGAPHFKVGASAAGLLRPDKIVVYLVDAADLCVHARALAVALEGVGPHGVPFSAELSGDGLLSWGGDPPADAGPVGGGVESWRLSVCRRLAEYLAAAKRAPLRSLRPAQYALGRLAADGVTLPSFAPASLPVPGGLASPTGMS